MVQVSTTTVIFLAGVFAQLATAMPAAKAAVIDETPFDLDTIPQPPRLLPRPPAPPRIMVTVTTTVTIDSCAAGSSSTSGSNDVDIEIQTEVEDIRSEDMTPTSEVKEGVVDIATGGPEPEITPMVTEDVPNSGDSGDGQQCSTICAVPTVTKYAPNCPMLRCPMAKCMPKPEVTTTSTFNCPDGVCDFAALRLQTDDCDSRELTPVTVTAACRDKCGPMCAAYTRTAAVACGTSFVGEEGEVEEE